MEEQLVIFFGITLLLTAALAHLAIWAPRKARVRVTAIVIVALFLPLAYGSLTELLGRPKPMELEWLQDDVADAEVLAAQMQEGEAIYLWLQLPDRSEPRAYALAWNEGLAKQLHEARNKAEGTGNGVRMRAPFRNDNSDAADKKFYAPPQPALPPKRTEYDTGRYDRSEDPEIGDRSDRAAWLASADD